MTQFVRKSRREILMTAKELDERQVMASSFFEHWNMTHAVISQYSTGMPTECAYTVVRWAGVSNYDDANVVVKAMRPIQMSVTQENTVDCHSVGRVP
jgi:hypothetical protein